MSIIWYFSERLTIQCQLLKSSNDGNLPNPKWYSIQPDSCNQLSELMKSIFHNFKTQLSKLL